MRTSLAARVSLLLLLMGKAIWADTLAEKGAQPVTVISLHADRLELSLTDAKSYQPGDLLLLRIPDEASTGRSEPSFQLQVEKTDGRHLTGRLASTGGSDTPEAVLAGLRVGDRLLLVGKAAASSRDQTASTPRAGDKAAESAPTAAVSSSPDRPSRYPQPAARRASITAIKDNKACISAGQVDGVSLGMTLDIMQPEPEGHDRKIGEIKIETVAPTASWGSVVGNTPADEVRLGQEIVLPLSPSPTAQVSTGKPGSDRNKKVSPVPHEKTWKTLVIKQEASRSARDLPHYSVPRTDRAYALLGTLAAKGLIRRYPSRVFYDDALFRHRTGDDLVLTRSQIAEAIAEALDNAIEESRGPSEQQLIALQLLVINYRKELEYLGYLPATILEAISQRLKSGLNIGVSGWGRAAYLARSEEGNAGDLEDVKEPGTRQSRGGRLDMQEDAYSLFGNGFQFFGRLNTRLARDDSDGVLRQAVLTKQVGKRLELEAGHGDLWWGPGVFGTLLLSDSAGPYDYLKSRWQIGRFMYEGFASSLQRSPLQRYLYGHRVEYAMNPNVRFGIAETLVTPGTGLDPVFLGDALIPFLPLYVIDLHRGFQPTDNNRVAQLYAEASLNEGFQMYGELLIDDFIVDRRSDAHHLLGQLFGVNVFDSGRPHQKNLRLEYARLDAGVYLPPRRPDDPYGVDGLPIGYPTASLDDRGAGFQSLRFEGHYGLSPRLTLGSGLEFADFGLDRPVLARQQIFRLNAAYDLSSRSSLSLRYRSTFTHNADFVLGTDVQDKALSLELMSAF